MNDGLDMPYTATPFSCMVTKGASPVLGMPRTKMLEVPTPPELSTQTPGTSVKTSPVLLGFSCSRSWWEIDVTEKPASSLARPEPPGVPVTTISETVAGVSASAGAAAGAVWALAPEAKANAAAEADSAVKVINLAYFKDLSPRFPVR